MLNLENLRTRVSNGEQVEYLFFWGHQPPKDGKISKSCFSQWYESPFVIDDIAYQTAEHWMMASKARLFSDDETLAKILESTDPKTPKLLDETVKNFDDDLWKTNARRLVTEGNLAKFEQNGELRGISCGYGELGSG